MKRNFTASNIDYIFEIIRGNEVVFYLKTGITGNNDKNLLVDDFGYPLSAVRNLNCIKNPIAVFRHVRKLLLEYLLSHDIPYFCFRGDTTRLSLYRSFAKRLESVGYDHTFYDGQFAFFKVAVKAIR